jgi:hypothetical protein
MSTFLAANIDEQIGFFPRYITLDNKIDIVLAENCFFTTTAEYLILKKPFCIFPHGHN